MVRAGEAVTHLVGPTSSCYQLNMSTSIGDNTKSRRGRKVTTGAGTLVGVRLLAPKLSALDTWIATQAEPRPTRPEAIRRLLAEALTKPAAGSIQSDASLDCQIAGQEAAIAEMPEHSEPSPEAAIATMDKALAEKDLIYMKNKRTRRKNAKRK